MFSAKIRFFSKTRPSLKGLMFQERPVSLLFLSFSPGLMVSPKAMCWSATVTFMSRRTRALRGAGDFDFTRPILPLVLEICTVPISFFRQRAMPWTWGLLCFTEGDIPPRFMCYAFSLGSRAVCLLMQLPSRVKSLLTSCRYTGTVMHPGEAARYTQPTQHHWPTPWHEKVEHAGAVGLKVNTFFLPPQLWLAPKGLASREVGRS